MRISLFAAFVFLGVNLGLHVLDSRISEIVSERRDFINTAYIAHSSLRYHSDQ